MKCSLNFDTDSTYYWVIAEKTGYDHDSTRFWIKRNQQTSIPDLSLCISKINPVNSKDDLLIFPNPVDKFLNLYSKNCSTREIEIIDLLGRTLLLQSLTNEQTTIDIGNLKGGFYFLQLRSNKGNSVTRKFVKL